MCLQRGGSPTAGGLLGTASEGEVKACYAIGGVSAAEEATGEAGIGGLIGSITSGESARSSYATGSVTGTGNVGGLIGALSGNSPSTSYYNSDRSSATKGIGNLSGLHLAQGGVSSKTMGELQTPTNYSGIYEDWNIDIDAGLETGIENARQAGDVGIDDPWDFGTRIEYPALKVDFDRDGVATAPEFGINQRARALGFSPISGVVGTQVKIAGEGFLPDAMSSVSFGGSAFANATFIEGDASNVSIPDTLSVDVPKDARTGILVIRVEGLSEIPSKEPFTVIPQITELLPGSASVGAEIKVVGTGFDPDAQHNSLSFGGSMYVPASSFTIGTDMDTLTVIVPEDARTGLIMLKVRDGAPVSSPQEFVVEPVIASFSPASGPAGTIVVIMGTGFSAVAAENIVRFGGGVQAAEPTNVSATSLTVVVPDEAQTGPITVEVGGHTATSPQEFVVEPVIASFSPASGPAGTIVVIMGTGFSAVAAENIVRFGGGVQAAEPTNVSATSLTVVVPDGAQTGTITVEVGGHTATSSDEFTLTNVPSAPMSLVATAVSTTEIGLVWTMPSSEGGSPITGYELELSTDGGSMFTSLEMTDGSTLSYQHTGLSAATTYHYRVAAVNSAGRGLYSSVASATTSTSDPGDPGDPGNPGDPNDEVTFGLSQEGVAPYVYPNPSLGEVHFGGVALGAPYRYKMYTIGGRLAHAGVFVGGSSVDVGSLSEGCYLLVIQSEEGEVLRTRLCILK